MITRVYFIYSYFGIGSIEQTPLRSSRPLNLIQCSIDLSLHGPFSGVQCGTHPFYLLSALTVTNSSQGMFQLLFIALKEGIRRRLVLEPVALL